MAPRAGMRQHLGKAGIGKQVLAFEVIQQSVQILALGVGSQLAHQLGAAVLPPRQQVQGPLPQAHTAAAAGLTPSFSRIWASISAAMSGCSRRNSRALSLPWPIFSP